MFSISLLFSLIKYLKFHNRNRSNIMQFPAESTNMLVRSLSPELVNIAKNELNEDPARVENDIQHLKDWIAKQPHLRARTDDQWLLSFLRGCKFNLERTKTKLDLYYTLRTTAADITRAIMPDDPKFMELLDTVPLPMPTTAGPGEPRVILIRSKDQQLDKYPIQEVMCASYFTQQIAIMEDDNAVVAGVRAIMDMDGASVSHFASIRPDVMKKMVAMGQDATPMRLKGFHYLNTPTGFETVFNVTKSLLSEKNRSRLNMHNKNYVELYTFIPKEILPTEYGGNAGMVAEMREQYKQKILSYLNWLKEEERYGTDESKRVGAPKTAEEMFGVDGSFKKLQID